MNGEPSTTERVVTGVSRGVGAVVVGPMLGAALDTRDVRDATRALVLQAAIGLGLGVMVGVAVGLWLGRR